jgi:hypothetical protein
VTDPIRDIPILTNPLLTEDGFVNEACINELGAAIRNMPEIHTRCAGDPEWNTPGWTFLSNITGPFAMWAVRQSPYGCPDGLEGIVKYLTACLKTAFPWDNAGMSHLTLRDISQTLHRILMVDPPAAFSAWNESKRAPTDEERFMNNRPADADFIDLHALLTNTVISIRDERRKNDAFDRKFEAEWAARTVKE